MINIIFVDLFRIAMSRTSSYEENSMSNQLPGIYYIGQILSGLSTFNMKQSVSLTYQIKKKHLQHQVFLV